MWSFLINFCGVMIDFLLLFQCKFCPSIALEYLSILQRLISFWRDFFSVFFCNIMKHFWCYWGMFFHHLYCNKRYYYLSNCVIFRCKKMFIILKGWSFMTLAELWRFYMSIQWNLTLVIKISTKNVLFGIVECNSLTQFNPIFFHELSPTLITGLTGNQCKTLNDKILPEIALH